MRSAWRASVETRTDISRSHPQARSDERRSCCSLIAGVRHSLHELPRHKSDRNRCDAQLANSTAVSSAKETAAQSSWRLLLPYWKCRLLLARPGLHRAKGDLHLHLHSAQTLRPSFASSADFVLGKSCPRSRAGRAPLRDIMLSCRNYSINQILARGTRAGRTPV